MSRGQNLQVSNIGKSIYSPKWYPNFYTLILPMFLSKYGTVDKVSYLGNRNTLKTLKKGDLIFGAEGFEKGRSVVIVEEKLNSITNIHGITFQQDKHDLNNAIFVKCILDYLRSKGLIDLFAVGGNGGSLAQKYWTYIPFPLFSDMLFIYTSSHIPPVHVPYFECDKYATAAHSIFFIIWVSVLVENPYMFPLSFIFIIFVEKSPTLWSLKLVKLGFVVMLDIVPVSSNFPIQNPDISSVPNVNAGWV